MAVSLTSVVYAAFGTVVWSAYDQSGRRPLRDVTPLVAVGAPVKLAPALLTVRSSEADRPGVVETFESLPLDEELRPQFPAALGGGSVDDPPEPPTLSARARNVARVGAKPALAPEEADLGQSLARADPSLEALSDPGAEPALAPKEADLRQALARADPSLEAPSDPSALTRRQGPVAPPQAISAPGGAEEPHTVQPAAGSSMGSASPTPAGVPASPEVATFVAPPSLKPAEVVSAWASADRALTSQADHALTSRSDGRTPAAAEAAGPGAETQPLLPAFKPLDDKPVLTSAEPPQIAAAVAFKPLDGEPVLALGEPPRMAAAAAEPTNSTQSFWSRFKAFFAPAPQRLLISDNGGGREADGGGSGVGAPADGPARAGGDQPGPSAGGGARGHGTDGNNAGGGDTTGSPTDSGGTSTGGGSTGGTASSGNQGNDQGDGSRGGRDGDDGGRGRGGDGDDGDGGRGGNSGPGGGKGGGGHGGDKGGGGKGGGGKGGGDKGGGGHGGGKGGGGKGSGKDKD